VPSPPPPGRRARPCASAADPKRDAPPPPLATTTSKAARQLLEELRALTFQRTLEQEEQQQAEVRRVRQRRSTSSSPPPPPPPLLERGPSADPSSGDGNYDETDDLLALAEEGDTFLPRLPSSRAPDALDAGRRRAPSPASSRASAAAAAAAATAAAAAAASAPGPADGAADDGGRPFAAAAVPADACLYFAFGANLSAATLRRRGVYEVYAHDPAFVEDPATRLAFRHRGGYATLRGGDIRAPGGRDSGGGVGGNDARSRERSVSPSSVGVLGRLRGASEARAPDDAGAEAASAAALAAASPAGGAGAHPSHVHGVLYALSRADLGRLAGAEGGYSLKEVDVVTYGGRRARALTFVSGAMATLPADVKPTERYLSAVREGAADNHLEPLWQAWLSGLETVPSAGLGREYFDSPSRHLGTLFLAAAALALAAWTAHTAVPPPPL